MMFNFKGRFSKQSVVNTLLKEHDRLIEEYHFNSDDGWSQVDGKGEEINRAYGRFTAIHDILMSIEL